MTRKFSVALALAMALVVSRGASAAVITPTDLNALAPGVQVFGSIIADPFDPAPPETLPVGLLLNSVFRNDATGDVHVRARCHTQPEQRHVL